MDRRENDQRALGDSLVAMTPSPPDNDRPTHTWAGDVAHWISGGCRTVLQLSFDGVLLSCIGLFLYVLFGVLGLSTTVWTPDYPVLSPTSDPYFAGLAFIAGCFTCLCTGSFVVIATPFGRDTDENALAVFWALVGFGFGASVLRWTAPTVFHGLMATLPW
ncbi:hypothetical protein [Halorussus salinisoli]|uniref:hypothetical protein n=1 Tax=Halorussus salinisoli TaxID=2558242 RepID=UPI0010C1794A|nr:hypothetical protein [Halorussus salinisoli]